MVVDGHPIAAKNLFSPITTIPDDYPEIPELSRPKRTTPSIPTESPQR